MKIHYLKAMKHVYVMTLQLINFGLNNKKASSYYTNDKTMLFIQNDLQNLNFHQRTLYQQLSFYHGHLLLT